MKNNEGFGMELQGERVGRVFKSIFEKLRITQVAGELNQLGINVRKTNNEFKTLEEILEEVSKLNNEDIMKASRLIAGEYNANHLFAIIKSL